MLQPRHRPPHLHEPGATYFLTGHTYKGVRCFARDSRKTVLRNMLEESAAKSRVRLHCWVLLDDHYHFLLTVPVEESAVVRFVRGFHSTTAIQVNKLDRTAGRRVWYQYWDRFPRSEGEFWMYFNYIHQNPIKHGYVPTREDIHQALVQYAFSSYHHYLREYGEALLTDIWRRYPVTDYLQFE